MNINASNSIHGLVDGIYYGQNARVDELNDRMAARWFPDAPLEPNFDPRPVPTKYSLFPVIDRRKPANVALGKFANYHPELNFNPGSRLAPQSGYYANIDTETILRNQAFALQHGADQNVYVPSSKSELYNVRIVSRPGEAQPHPDLFASGQYQTSVDPASFGSQGIGSGQFNNHTRTQLRGSSGV